MTINRQKVDNDDDDDDDDDDDHNNNNNNTNNVTMAPGRAVATAGINSKVDVCEKAEHHTELFW